MTKRPDGSKKDQTLQARLALVEVERAVMEFRRGLPIIINGQEGSILALCAEFADRETLDFMEQTAGVWPHINLTRRRAETLKIRDDARDGQNNSQIQGLAVELDRPDPASDPRVALAQILHLSDPANDLAHPLQGPFRARPSALSGPQRASLQLAKLSGLLPATLAAPLDKAGQDKAIASGLVTASHTSILAYERRAARAMAPASQRRASLKPVTSAKVPLVSAPDTTVFAFRPQGADGGGPEHLAIVIGKVETSSPVLVRLHSECFTGDLLGSLKCDCGQQLGGAIDAIAKSGSGILLYLAQEGRGIGLMNKLRAYALQDQGFDTVEANLRLGFEVDERLFEAAAEMLRQLGVHQVQLMTNNPDKVRQLETHAIKVTKRVPHTFQPNEHNASYLATKASKTGHLL